MNRIKGVILDNWFKHGDFTTLKLAELPTILAMCCAKISSINLSI